MRWKKKEIDAKGAKHAQRIAKVRKEKRTGIELCRTHDAGKLD